MVWYVRIKSLSNSIDPIKNKYVFILILFIASNNIRLICQQPNNTSKVVVCDQISKEPLAGVTVKDLNSATFSVSDVNGIVGFKDPTDNSVLVFSYIGYADSKQVFKQLGDTLFLEKRTLKLNEVTVSAQEEYGFQSSTIIGAEASNYFQPSNLNDLLQLLPGNITQNSSFRNFLSPAIRETDQNPYSSLGTRVDVDGISQFTYASMQTRTTASGYGSENIPFDEGTDFRTVSAGNINRVEVIKGVASVSEGNSTNAIIKVNTNIFAPDNSFNVKYNPGNYQVSFSNAIKLNKNNRLGINGEYILARTDDRTPSIYYNLYKIESAYRYYGKQKQSFTSRVSFQGTSNNQFSYQNFLSNNEYYQEREQNLQWLTRYTNYEINNWIKKLDFKLTTNYKYQNISRGFYVSNDISPYTYATEEGLHKGVFLPSNRLSEYNIWASPLTIDFKGELYLQHHLFKSTFLTLIGIENNLSKNFGRGVVINPNSPTQISDVIIRDQNFSEIPALLINAFYAEETYQKQFSNFQINTRVGYRHSFYNSHGSIKNFAEPRATANIGYSISPTKSVSFFTGVGLHQQVPIMKQIYPDYAWFDFPSANIYDSQSPDLNYLYITTYKQSTNNTDLKPAKSLKREIGISYESSLFDINVVYFNEDHTNNIKFQKHYVANTYPIFDLSEGYLPSLSPIEQNLPYSNYTLYNPYFKPLNVGRTDKNGIEWTLNTAKINPLQTSFNISGAWFKTLSYEYDGTNYYIPDIKNFDDILLLAKYDSKKGKDSERISSNIRTITHIPQLGLVFSFTFQTIIKHQYQFIRETNTPIEFIDVYDNILPFENWMINAPEYQDYILTPNIHDGIKEAFPIHSQINFQLTKEVGENIRISFLANNMFNNRPIYVYKVSGTSVRLNTPLYFSLNLKLTL